MIRSVFCPQCRIRFEVVDMPRTDGVRCPHCSGALDLGKHSKLVEKLGEYSIVEMIGQGGMGQVFRAVAPGGAEVAVKIMGLDLVASGELQERFEREMTIMASLSHENIVKLLDRGSTSAYKYFVMELVEGETLRALIGNPELTELRIVQIMVESLQAIGYAHSKGIIHRDIKPENILIDRSGKVKVTDFGLARKATLTSSEDGHGITATNAFMGTENYMSPEQKISPKAVTHKSDLYSMGVLLYEMLTGGVLPMGLFQPPSAYKTLGDYWDNLTFRLLDINPDLRPDNCQAVIDEIRQAFPERKPLGTSPRPTIQTALPSVPPVDPGPRPDARGPDRMEQENDRIRQEFELALQKAQGLMEQGEVTEALPLWERALLLTNDEEEQSRIREWLSHCRVQIAQQNRPKTQAFLCPLCRKTFDRLEGEAIPDSLNCPKCAGELRYDRGRKQLVAPNRPIPSPQKNLPAKAPTQVLPHSSQAGEEGEEIPGWLRQGLILLAFLLIGDLLFPSALNDLVSRAFQLGLEKSLSISTNVAVIYVRNVLQLLFVLLATYRAGKFIVSWKGGGAPKE